MKLILELANVFLKIQSNGIGSIIDGKTHNPALLFLLINNIFVDACKLIAC
jgi:hypothetical protein